MITRHNCLDNEVRNGDYLSCAVCRVLLLEAFRAPADVPRRPHLTVPPGRTVPLYPETGSVYPDPDWIDQEPVIAEHTTGYGATPSDESAGGLWWARCSCGWEANGGYARTTGAPMAERLARLKANQHREDPT
jgi:hypothetical protein